MAYIKDLMTDKEKALFKELCEALIDKDNVSRNDAKVQYNLAYADSFVLLGQVRHYCLGCYPSDVEYIERCHHDAYDVCPCSLWKYRGGKVHKANTRIDEKAGNTENQTNADRQKLVRTVRIKRLKETLKRNDLAGEYRNGLVEDLERLVKEDSEGQ